MEMNYRISWKQNLDVFLSNMKPVWVAERNVFIRDISNHKLRLFPALLYFHEMRLTVTRQLIMTFLPSLK